MGFFSKLFGKKRKRKAKSRRSRDRARPSSVKALDKVSLWKGIAKDERARRTKSLASHKAKIAAANATRRASREQAQTTCSAGRERAKIERVQAKTLALRAKAARLHAKHAAARSKAARLAAQKACARRASHGELTQALKSARHAYRVEHARIRELRAIERSARIRKEKPSLAKTRGPRQETDEEVRSNLPPELVSLFNRVRKHLKGGARISRTEQMLQYAEEHPREVYASMDDATDALVAQLESRQRRGY